LSPPRDDVPSAFAPGFGAQFLEHGILAYTLNRKFNREFRDIRD
jgi:hypothetical protein